MWWRCMCMEKQVVEELHAHGNVHLCIMCLLSIFQIRQIY